ncbi:XI-B [Linum perenne]
MAPSQEALSNSSQLLGNSHDHEAEKLRILITCIVEKKVGFCHGKPVAAITIHRCLIKWRSFVAQRTSIFDRLVQAIADSAFENQDDCDQLAYWLSNTAMLLFLIQRTLKCYLGCRDPADVSSFYGRMALSFRPPTAHINNRPTSDVKTGKEFIHVVEPKYPATLFRQQIIALVETLYGVMRDNLKFELSPLLGLCIQQQQAPETEGNDVGASDKSSSNWNCIVEKLEALLIRMKENYVPPCLIQEIFCQTFAYINAELFNSLLLGRERCTFSNVESVKSGLDVLEAWSCGQAKEHIGSAWDELKHTRQTVGFLVIPQKSKFSYDDIVTYLCPVLSIQQLYKVCTLYGHDSFSPDAISTMKTLVAEVTDPDNFRLLGNCYEGYVSSEKLCRSIQEMDYSQVRSPDALLKNPDFQFLLDF